MLLLIVSEICNCSSVGCPKCVQFHKWFRLHSFFFSKVFALWLLLLVALTRVELFYLMCWTHLFKVSSKIPSRTGLEGLPNNSPAPSRARCWRVQAMLVGTADNLKMFSGIRKYINVLLSEKSRDFSLVQPKFVMFACFSYRSVIFAIVRLMTQPRTDFKTKLRKQISCCLASI